MPLATQKVPLVFSLAVTWPLWSISSTQTIYPLCYLNLISQIFSIVSSARLTTPFTQMEPIANSGRKKETHLHPRFGLRQNVTQVSAAVKQNANCLDESVPHSKSLGLCILSLQFHSSLHNFVLSQH